MKKGRNPSLLANIHSKKTGIRKSNEIVKTILDLNDYNQDTNKQKRHKMINDDNIKAKKINFEDFISGVAFLGVVEEIRELYVKLSLPNMKTGFCSIKEISTFVSILIEEFSCSGKAQVSNILIGLYLSFTLL